MRKKIVAIALMVFLGAGSTAYASTSDTANNIQVTVTSSTLTQNEIAATAGVLPDSLIYSLERGIEKLQIAITLSEARLAALKAQLATERAAEAFVMYNEAKNQIAGKALSDYMEMLASAAEHIKNAVEAKTEAVQTLETLAESYKISEEILNSVLQQAPESAKVAIETALNQQDKAIVAVNGFYAAKKATFAAKQQLEAAKKELKAAKKSGNAEAIRIAEDKVKEAEAIKDELEGFKDAADAAKDEVKHLVIQAEKRIELGIKQIEKANEKMEKVEEKSRQTIKKAETKAREKAKEDAEKSREEADEDDEDDDD